MDLRRCLNYFSKTQKMNSSDIFLNSNLNISNLLFDNEKYQKGHTSYYSKKNAKELQKNKIFRSSSVLNNITNKMNSQKYKIKQQKNPRDFYLTASRNNIFNKSKTNSLIFSSLTKYNISQNKESFLDRIHNKKIDLCMDLIKNLSEKDNNINKSLKLNEEYNGTNETYNIIQKLKNFNLISNGITNNNQRIPISFDNSMSTYYNTNYANNTNNSLSNNVNFNMSNYSLINSFNPVEMKNTNIDTSKAEVKSTINKSINNLNKNNTKPINNNVFKENEDYNPKNEINFHTGFIRRQKNIDIYSKLENKSSKPYHKKRNIYEDKKLALDEIDEYRAIIKEIENRQNKKLHRSQSVIENNQEKNEIVIKDKLTEELNKIYSDQKKLFLDYIKEKATSNNKSKLDLYKEAVNNNIHRINKNKRIPNSFIDGYSLFDGKTNKVIEQYNYILGDKFHDKFQKSIKEKKLFQCINELENKYKQNVDELLIKYHAYKKLFEPKLYSDRLEKEKENDENDIDLDFRKINNYLITKDSDSKETEKEIKKVEDTSDSKKERIYKEYMEFKNRYKDKYLNQNDNNA